MGDMLRARRRGVFRREYELSTDAGPVTSLAGGRRESCDFSLADKDYRIERVGRKQFRLLGPEGAVALAERQTGREWTIQTSAGNLTLAKPSIWRSHWEVLQGGTARGEIRHDGAFKRTYSASVPAAVPLPVAIFTFYVVLVIFERQANASASAGAAGASSG
jgi:hypothetical protein